MTPEAVGAGSRSLGRVVLTVLGAAGMISGAYLGWFDVGGGVIEGTKIGLQAFWDPNGIAPVEFSSSVGLVAVVLGVLALLSLAFAGSWPTRIVGVLGILAWVLFTVSVYRGPSGFGPEGSTYWNLPFLSTGEGGSLGNLELGAWVVLAGGILTLAAGLLPSRRTT